MAINVVEINAALEQIEINKGISRERVIEALKESMAKAYRKSLGGDDAKVEVIFDLENGVIEMYQIKDVVADVEDDLLQISPEEAYEESGKKYKVGDEYHIYADINELRKAIVLTVKNLMKQKFAEAEKEVLHEQFKDKINTLITGRVEQYDDRGASINIGRMSVYLPRKEMIKDEKFVNGETIKLFVSSQVVGNKGPQIVVSRANEGFLKALMTEEIHDIYDGTIIIKAVAREAGERSKVAVYSNDVNVDPAGACIGPNGSRIQKVVSQLGNGSSKEKIDIIAYKDNAGLYIMEALKPAKVAGISVDEENKSAIVIVEDDSLSLAIGRKGVNARLANKLTGYNIDIKIKSEALEEGLEYQTFDELNALEMEEKARKIAEAQREALVYQNKEESLPGVPEGYVAPQARSYEEEQNDFDTALMEQAEVEEVIAPVNEVKEETPVQAQEEKAEEVAPVEEAPTIETTEVKTTTTLEDLEKSLEGKGNKQAKKGNGPKRKKKAEEEQQEAVVTHADGPRMAIYTEEELKEIEAEENDDYVEEDEDDIDYDDYDQYYDED